MNDVRWKHGRVTIEWPVRVFGWWRAVGVIRVHDDERKIPGDYNCAGSIIVKDGGYEVMGFIAKASLPSRSEFKAIYQYLHSLGLKKYRHVRATGGRVRVIPAVKSR